MALNERQMEDREREKEFFLENFKYLINERFVDTSLNQPRMWNRDSIKKQLPKPMQSEIEEKGWIELDYAEPVILEEEYIGDRSYYIVAQQTWYDEWDALHIYTHYYLDDRRRFICPPIEWKTFWKRCSWIPTLKWKLLEAWSMKQKIDREWLISLAKNKILKDEPKQYTYDYMNDIEFSEWKDDICVVRREQENGYDYGYDTFYLVWWWYDNQLHSKKIHRWADNKYIHVSDVRFDWDNIYIKLSNDKEFKFNSSKDLEKYEIPTIYKVKQNLLMTLSDDGKINFNYSIQEADNADMVILYRDNTMYQLMIKKLEIINENQNPPLRIYSVIIPANAQWIENQKELQNFIDRYNPITDWTIAQRAEKETEKIEEGKEMNNNFFKELTILNMLCKKHGIKTVYLLTNVSYASHNFLLEHWWYVKKSDWSYEGVGKDDGYKWDPVAPRKDFLKDVKIEITGVYIDLNNRYGPNSTSFTSNVSTRSDTLLIADRHCSQAAELFRKKWWKAILIAWSYFENWQFSETFKGYDEKNWIEDIFAETMANNVIKIYEKRRNKSNV